MNVFPDFDGINGIGDLKEAIGALLTFVRIIAVLMLIVWAVTWTVATASKARAGLLVTVEAAALAGGGVAWINWPIALGDQL